MWISSFLLSASDESVIIRIFFEWNCQRSAPSAHIRTKELFIPSSIVVESFRQPIDWTTKRGVMNDEVARAATTTEKRTVNFRRSSESSSLLFSHWRRNNIVAHDLEMGSATKVTKKEPKIQLRIADRSIFEISMPRVRCQQWKWCDRTMNTERAHDIRIVLIDIFAKSLNQWDHMTAINAVRTQRHTETKTYVTHHQGRWMVDKSLTKW